MNHKLFVYGTLKQQGSRNGWLIQEGGVFVQNLQLTIPFTLINLGMIPALVAADEINTIHGELYHISTSLIPNIDYIEGHPKFYQRQFIQNDIEAYILPLYYLKAFDVKSIAQLKIL